MDFVANNIYWAAPASAVACYAGYKTMFSQTTTKSLVLDGSKYKCICPEKIRRFEDLTLAEVVDQKKTFPTKKEVIAEVTKILDEYQVPGCLLSIRECDTSLVECAIGLAKIDEPKQKASLDMHFRIGSVTKSMTAFLVVKLIDDPFAISQRFSLESTLDRWFPEFENAESITILNLLNMTSGIGNFTDEKRFLDIFNIDPELHWNVEDLLRYGSEMPTVFKPGTDWMYCNTNYVILGRICEIETGKTLDVLYKEYLWNPLDMTHTSLPTEPDLPTPFMRGYGVYRGDKFEDCTDWSPSFALASGGVVSNVDDMQKWAKAIATGSLMKCHQMTKSNPLLNDASASLPEAKKHVDYKKLEFFYGLGVVYDHNWIWHNGSIFGYETICAAYPLLGLTLVVSINQATLPKFKSKGKAGDMILRRISELYTPLTPVQQK